MYEVAFEYQYNGKKHKHTIEAPTWTAMEKAVWLVRNKIGLGEGDVFKITIEPCQEGAVNVHH